VTHGPSWRMASGRAKVPRTVSLRPYIVQVCETIAAAQPGIRTILAGMCGGGNGQDQFDLRRGGKVERRPARFVIHPSMGVPVLHALWPRQYRKLLGNI
jgi:hypothetical protein